MNQGKYICNQLKDIRRNIANENGIELDIPECTYSGECDGTCPRCEAELQYLERELTMRTVMGKAAVVAGLALGITGGTLTTASAQEVLPDRQSHTNTLSETNPSASDTCIFKGSVIDSKNGDPLLSANVILKDKDNIIVAGARTDFDGNFSIRAPKGKYEVEVAYIGFATLKTIMNLDTDTLSIGAFTLTRTGTVCGMIPVITGMPKHRTPLIEIGTPESGERIDADRIQHFPQ